MNKLAAVPISFCILAAAAVLSPVLAGEFDVVIDRTYTVESGGAITVVETHRVTNNSENLLISRTNEETFQIPVVGDNEPALQQSVQTAVITAEGATLNPNIVYKERFAELRVPYPRELRRGQTLEFTLQYTNFGLVEKSGALFDIYAPGFVEDFKFSQGLTDVRYNTTFRLASGLPENNFIIPDPASNQVSGGYRVVTFTQESLIGRTVWIQMGRTQFYSFNITQVAPATDSRNSGYMNEYRIVLPRSIDEVEIMQNVYFTSITPDPFQVLEDSEGNLIGYFKVPSHENTRIVVEGYAEVAAKEEEIRPDIAGTLAEITADQVMEYTGPAEFWEVGAPQIQSLAADLRGSEMNVYEIVEDTYRHVVDTIDYSEIKRFGINERQGALKTLNGGAAVCMEYSDLFLTLTRAQGIPARAAFGYGYDSRLPDNQQEAHQWVQVFMPGSGKWVSVDVTWGESGPALIGGDLNHFFTHTAGLHPNQPAMVERVSYGDNLQLDAPEFRFSAVESIPQSIFTTSPQELLQRYPEVESFDINQSLSSFVTGLRGAFSGSNPSAMGQVMVICGGVLAFAAVLFLFSLVIRGGKKQQFQTPELHP
ncbi:MAG: Transglutaminase-like superfamily protein [candidate division WS6 bacterium OLB20]|uniref:Transglutaminase-like superfamily protein n=1 Tax=candidate division WS6 bacterium OLB20 TaxID=1617426 RepID=A0A136LZ84_9BACT|nr:MAG: Transglutaminase-like superfamily protein [candidate division WS6 bacterium OLB20]